MSDILPYYFLVRPDSDPPEFLRERWNTGELADIRAQIVAALSGSDKQIYMQSEHTSTEDTINAAFDLLKCLDVTYNGSSVKLLDLRGIDLQGLSLGNNDFAYCSFDYAVLNHCVFHSTHLQSSSFYRADLSHSIFFEAQASPVYMVEANLMYAAIENSFFMHSDFRNACLEHISLCDANLDRSSFSPEDATKTKSKI